MSEVWSEKHRDQMLRAPDGWPVWQIDDLLSRRPVTPRVAERLHRLNPDGVRQGDIPRGWHRKRTAKMIGWQMNFLSVRFVPRKTLAALPKNAFYRDGKRRYVAARYLA